MPIEELLALYRRNIPEPSNVTSTSTDDEEEQPPQPKATESDTQPNSSESTSQLENDKLADQTLELIDRIEPHKPSSNLSKLISTSEDALYDISDDEEEDEDDTPEDNWRRTIQIGPDHQAAVPEYPAAVQKEEPKQDDEKAVKEEAVAECASAERNVNSADEAMETIADSSADASVNKEGLLLWSPRQLDEQKVERFLKSFQNSEPIHPLPSEKSKTANQISSSTNQLDGVVQLRDDELALFVLLQNSYEIETSLSALSEKNKLDKGAVDLFTFIEQWSEADCLAFEDGLRTYGKDFHQIQKNKLTHKTVNELVNFYYFWKKTERHDMFTSKFRFEKKKYSLNPMTIDLMDHFLDGGDQQSTGNQNSFNSTSSSHNNSVLHKHASSLTLLPTASAPNHLSNLSNHHLTTTSTDAHPTVSSTDLSSTANDDLPTTSNEEENSNPSSDGHSSRLVINEVANSNEDEPPATIHTKTDEPSASSIETRPDSSTVPPIDSGSASNSVTSSTNPSAE